MEGDPIHRTLQSSTEYRQFLLYNGIVALKDTVRKEPYYAFAVTRRVKGYTRFVGKYVTGRRKRCRPHKVYIYIFDQDHQPSRPSHVRLSV